MQVHSRSPRESPEAICARVFRELRPRTPLPEIHVSFRPYAGVNSFAQWVEGRLELRISDVLEAAPAPVLEALIHILLGKLFRKPVARRYLHRYRLYLNRRDVQRTVELLRGWRGRKFVSAPQGQYYNLEEIFDELNQRFFGGLLVRPRLGWSRQASRTTLGHWDPSHNTIVISKILDDARVPRLALEYILFHEMLHLEFPAQARGAQRRLHTSEFRKAERTFPGHTQARQMLKRLLA